MPDSLNARMAQALAPVLGEAAVYTYTFECPVCRVKTAGTSNLPVYCSEIHGGRTVWMTCDTKPVTFADPAVGWGLWERWASSVLADIEVEFRADHTTTVEITAYTTLSYATFRGKGPTMWEALLSAWAQALGVGVSGDA